MNEPWLTIRLADLIDYRLITSLPRNIAADKERWSQRRKGSFVRDPSKRGNKGMSYGHGHPIGPWAPFHCPIGLQIA